MIGTAERLILESLLSGVIIIDAETLEIIDLNNAACEITGYSKDEIIGMTCFDTICIRERVDCPMIKMGKIIDKAETTLRKKDGSFVPILKTAKQVKIDDRDCIIESFHDITEEKNLENALRQSEGTFRTVTEQAPIGIGILDLNGNVIQVFGTWLEIFGMSNVEDSHNINFFKGPMIPRDKKQELLEGNLINYEAAIDFSWIHASNSYKCSRTGVIHLKTSITPLKFGEDAIIKQYLVLFQDITESKEIEIALRKSEAVLNSTGHMAKVGGWELDIATNEVSWTEETYRIHEIPIGQQPPLEEAINFFHPDEREKLSKAIQRAMDHGEPYDMELRFITAKGKKLWTHTTCAPVVVDGKRIRLVGAFQDITESKRRQQEIIQQSAKLDAVTRSTLDAIIMIDPEGLVQFWNPASEHIFGYSEKEMLGQNLHSIIVPSKFFEAHRIGFEKFKITGEGAAIGKVLELSGLKKDGSEFPVELALTAIKLGDGWGAVGIIRDITERKQNEQELLLQQKELEIYISLLRHDLNNDLAGIVGALEIVKMMMNDDPEEAEQFLDSSLALTARMSNLLRAVSRTQNLQDEPLVNMIREVAKLSADAKIGLEIQVIVEDEVEDLKSFGGRLLPMVFENLFRNAAQHAGETPKITVEISTKENQAWIVVSDNGPGVPDDMRDQLFTRGTSTKEGGGLGLHLSKKIVEAVGGSIELLPKKKGSGAQFEIVLPLSQ